MSGSAIAPGGNEREPLPESLPWWLAQFVDEANEQAREHELEAKRLRALAEKALHPPEGVTVEPGAYGNYSVRFVGPTTDFSKKASA